MDVEGAAAGAGVTAGAAVVAWAGRAAAEIAGELGVEEAEGTGE